MISSCLFAVNAYYNEGEKETMAIGKSFSPFVRDVNPSVGFVETDTHVFR